MTHEQLHKEFQYRVAMSLAKEMLKGGVINEDEYRAVDARMIMLFQPIMAGLYP